ncbi:MAG TPA: aminotransferase class III-fold pyridoxal phosphate-dependent enzyme [Gemmatimonadaceae bacterium]|nr:aminotransferase class III-fold pyridoxal phosphate-dependent enzyme [Gemmatimonadaceae bacterium]
MPNRIALSQPLPVIVESDRLWARAERLIPAGTQTLAKGPGQYVRGVAPKYLRSGRGAHVWDVDANEYLDMNMGIGPLVLGYADPVIDDAIRRQLEDGITFSLMHPLEVEVAESLRAMIPNAESVRFTKTGAEATSAAVRVARAFTGRTRVLCCGYHGWHDWYIGVTDRAAGIPDAVGDLTSTFGYNDVDSLEDALDDEVACVILEPMTFEEPRDGFLEAVRAATERAGALLIFDEMWTGFRYALGGAQEYFGVTPDLATYSKAIANGMPIAAVTGRADVMAVLERDVFFFSTFGGEALSLAAAKATLRELRARSVPDHLACIGTNIRDGYNALAATLGASAWTRCVGHPSRTMITFDASAGPPLVLKSLMQQELLRHGVLWSGTNVLSAAHQPGDATHLLAAFAAALEVIASGVAAGTLQDLLRGEPVEPVFRRTANFNIRPRVRA